MVLLLMLCDTFFGSPYNLKQKRVAMMVTAAVRTKRCADADKPLYPKHASKSTEFDHA